jgi:methionyl-tRNA formyltransferase
MEDIRSLRIVFLGTPDFAVASLEALCKAGFNIVGVVTAPDKPAGRGLQLQQSAVKQFALQQRIPVLQPVKLKDPSFLAALDEWKADLQVVVAFRMLPEIVWNRPRLGTINLHGSLLPQYRGAAPINWAIINGETETGVTTFLLQHAIDTGNILLQERIPIGEEENAGILYDRMKISGANLLVRTIEEFVTNRLSPTPQENFLSTQKELLHHAPKIEKETGVIHWKEPAQKINNLIRGLSPVPGAHTQLEGKLLKIYKASVLSAAAKKTPGEIETDGKTFLHFYCGEGKLSILEMQLEGKKRMTIEEFLRGYRFTGAV